MATVGRAGGEISETVKVRGSYSGKYSLSQVAEAFMRANTGITVDVDGSTNREAAAKLAARESQVMVLSGPLVQEDVQSFARAFGGERHGWPQAYPFGQFCVYIVVNKANPIDRISYAQLADIYRGRAETWDKIGPFPKSRITVVWERQGSKSREIIVNDVMKEWFFREDYVVCNDCFGVEAKVFKDANAIGFCLYRMRSLDAVKVVKVGRDAKGPFCLPTEENVYGKQYPLVEDLTLYLHPAASVAAKAFCEFACGSESGKIAKESLLFPELARRQFVSQRNMAEAKAGKGTPVSMTGLDVPGSAVEDLALRYVQAKAVMQLTYAPAYTDVPAVGEFITGSKGIRELMLLGDKPSDRALEAHGTKWTELNPAEYMIAGRAVGIVVNAANGTDSLTMEQIKGVFAGGIADWAAFGHTGQAATVARPGIGKAETKINRFGLKMTDPVVAIFSRECLQPVNYGRVTLKKDSNDVIAAIGMDPQAIGFVDLAACSNRPLGVNSGAESAENLFGGTANVKVLAIQVGLGEKAKIMRPTEENIRNAMYPLSQRMYLYLHPKASDVAKDFAKFLATCGASEATPYADTVKSVMDAYAKHGLIPLADAAIERRAKDAAAAARAAAAKAEREKAAGGKATKKPAR